jgi:S-adenosylmethionine:tRNA ribosyltransferase-isomerase
MKPIPYIEKKDYQYELPEKAIAKYPLPERDSSKLLVYKNGKNETSQFKFLAEFLPENATLVFNNTKVVEARLQF